MPQSSTLYVGLDVHKAALAVASVDKEHGAEVVSLGTIGTRQGAIEQRLRRLQAKSPPLVFVYAAGPCGYGLSRSVTTPGPGCWVVAPSLSPGRAAIGSKRTSMRRSRGPG